MGTFCISSYTCVISASDERKLVPLSTWLFIHIYFIFSYKILVNNLSDLDYDGDIPNDDVSVHGGDGGQESQPSQDTADSEDGDGEHVVGQQQEHGGRGNALLLQCYSPVVIMSTKTCEAHIRILLLYTKLIYGPEVQNMAADYRPVTTPKTWWTSPARGTPVRLSVTPTRSPPSWTAMSTLTIRRTLLSWTTWSLRFSS